MANPEIPEALLSKLHALRHVLERYGSVLLRPREGRRRGGYRLRYWNKDAQGCRHQFQGIRQLRLEARHPPHRQRLQHRRRQGDREGNRRRPVQRLLRQNVDQRTQPK